MHKPELQWLFGPQTVPGPLQPPQWRESFCTSAHWPLQHFQPLGQSLSDRQVGRPCPAPPPGPPGAAGWTAPFPPVAVAVGVAVAVAGAPRAALVAPELPPAVGVAVGPGVLVGRGV